MTTKPFDQFNKSLFQELLSSCGQVIPNFALLGEERAIDVFFAPHPDSQPDQEELGVLASIAKKPALLEPFRSGLADENIETCIMKLFMVNAQLRNKNTNIPSNIPPHLWIIAAEVSDRILTDFGAIIDAEMGEGFYKLTKGLKTTIVAVAELPTTPETIWLRLMGKGRTQEDAIADLLMLPDSDPKRSNALNLLVTWQIKIEDIIDQIEQEEEVAIMALSQAYLEWEKQTKRLGITQGLQQERRDTIESLIQSRFGTLDQDLQSIIPQWMNLDKTEHTRLILQLPQLSKAELIQYFQG
jgi:hypothetical protein